MTAKWIRNFFIVNACAVVPMWWMVFGWMPNQVKVDMRGTSSVALLDGDVILQGEEHGVWEKGTVWRFYLQEGMEWQDIAFRLPEGMDGSDVRRVRLEKWKLLSLEKAGGGLERKMGDSNAYFFRNPRFERVGLAHGKPPLGLVGVEVLLLGMSWCFAKRHREERWRTLWPAALGVAAALAMLMQVALPIQSYVMNRSLFPFTPGNLGGAVAMHFVGALAVGGVCFLLLARCFGRWVLSAALAFVACAYLEAVFLSADLPSLNGDWTFFANRKRAIWDVAVWCGVFAGVLGARRWLTPRLAGAGMFLAVLSAAAIFGVKPEQKADDTNLIVNDFAPIETVIRSVTYSTNRNVMVFVIDSLEREQAHAIMEDSEAGPELREKFRGFTEYADNVGTGNASEYAVAALFTGKYPENAAGLQSYFVSIFGGESALGDYLAEDASVYVSAMALGYGYTNRKISRRESDSRVEGWKLEEILRFRWIPFAAKWKTARIMELGRPHSDSIDRENVAYPILAERPIQQENPLSFLFLHTMGVHFPILWNRQGDRLPSADDTFSGAVEAGIYVLKQLGALFDTFRDRGIYDNSLILVLADHGNHGHKADTPGGLPGIARPFLWVKAPGAQKDFSSSNLATSHANIANLLRTACREAPGEEEVGHLLHSKRRLYREAFGLNRTDWWVEDDGSVVMESGEMATSDENLRPLKAGHTYSFDLTGSGASELDDIELSGFFFRFWPRWFNDRPEVRIRFRPPTAQGRWRVKLTVLPWMWSPDEMENNDRGACFRFHSERQEIELRTSGEADLRGLVADADGFLCITIEREAGIRSICRLTRLMVEEEN